MWRLAVLLGLLAWPVAAHDGVVHKTPEEAAAHATAPTPGVPFPVDIRARFALTDHTGREVTDRDYSGKLMAVFFG